MNLNNLFVPPCAKIPHGLERRSPSETKPRIWTQILSVVIIVFIRTCCEPHIILYEPYKTPGEWLSSTGN